MTRLLPAWRASLRLAVRSITRAKGRSVLVVLMVGIPVMLTVIVTTLALTTDVSARESIPSTMGSSQASVSYLSTRAIAQNDLGEVNSVHGNASPSAKQFAGAAATLTSLTDSSVIPVRQGYVGVKGNGGSQFGVLQVDLTREGTRGLVTAGKGRLPAAADEALVSPSIAADPRYGIGDSMLLENGTKLTIVGIGRIASPLEDSRAFGAAVLPTTVIPTTAGSTDPASVRFLIDRKAPITRDQVVALNKQGYLVKSRALLEESTGIELGSNARLVRIIVIAIMIEVVLLAGPAFAVGVRRQRRELALIAAAGGSPRDIRRVVIAQAAVLGFGASLIGAVTGLVVSRFVYALGIPALRSEFGPFEWSSLLVLVTVLLGSAAAMIAAYAPARQVSSEPLPTVLAGRRIEAGARSGWPVFGLVLTIAGVVATILASRGGLTETGIAYGSILVVVGVVFLIPTLIRLIARLAPRLPLPLRLSLRDTARHTARSAPAIAAVMAAIAGVVALGIGGSSDDQQRRQEYAYTLPSGVGVINIGADFESVGAKVRSILPGRTLTPLPSVGASDRQQVVVETSGCTDRDGCRWQGLYSYDVAGMYRNVLAEISVADPATLAAWGVRLTAAQSDALLQGKALAYSTKGTGPGNTLTVRAISMDPPDGATAAEQSKASVHTVNVIKADFGLGKVPTGLEPYLSDLVISPATAKAFGIEAVPYRARISGTISAAQEKRLAAAFAPKTDAVTLSVSSLSVERGYDSESPVIMLVLGIAGGVAILIGTLSATGLALNDARPDFATLNAIGAAPRTRRAMAAAQALTIAIIGVVLGVLVGLLPGILAARSLTYNGGLGTNIVDFPWLLVGFLVLVVPLLAAGASGLFIRNNTVLIRRLAG